MRTIGEKLDKAVGLIENHFQNWQTPSFFVQFGTGFNADLLFDKQPQVLELSKLPNMPDYHNPDCEHPSLLYGPCMGVPVLALRGHRHLYEGLGTYPCVFQSARHGSSASAAMCSSKVPSAFALS